MKQKRPVNLDLTTVRFPATAVASILHRVSGVIMFISAGILVWMLAQSLSSEQGFNSLIELFDMFVVKFVLWGILTALAYHFCAGIRHLMMDMGYFEELESGKQSSLVTFAATAILAIVAGVWVW